MFLRVRGVRSGDPWMVRLRTGGIGRARILAQPAGSRPMTRTVSSPAMVPRTSCSSALSKAEARYWAAPGGVRSTTRLALDSARDQQLGAQPARGRAWPERGLPRRRGSSVAALGRHGVHQRAGGGPDLTASSSSRSRERVAWVTLDALPASIVASSACDRTSWWVTRSTICWCRAFLVAGRSADGSGSMPALPSPVAGCRRAPSRPEHRRSSGTSIRACRIAASRNAAASAR